MMVTDENMLAPSAGSNGDRHYVELSFAPNIPLVSVARRFVSQFAAAVLGNREVSDKLAVALHELMENAVKFSSDRVSTIRVDLVSRDDAPSARITTRNRARPADLETLARLVSEMEQADDSLAFYIALMERTGQHYDQSRLGLGRVFAEAGMTLKCSCEDGNAVVQAELNWTGDGDNG